MRQIYAEAFSNLALPRFLKQRVVSLDWFSGLLDNQRENLIKINFVLSFLIEENKIFEVVARDAKGDKWNLFLPILRAMLEVFFCRISNHFKR